MLTSTTRRAIALGLAAATAISLSACSGGETPPAESDGPVEMRTIEVGIIPSPDAAVLYLGEEQGFFEERGIKLNYNIGQGGAALVPPVVSGQYQLGFSNVVSIMQAREEGLPLTILNPSGTSWGTEDEGINNLLAMEGSGIESPADLNGKRVGVNTLGNLLEVLARVSIDEAGGDSSTVEFVPLPPPDLVNALVSGELDATMCNEPFCMLAIEQGAVQIANSFYDLAPGVEASAAAWFTSDPQLAADADLFERLQAAIAESNAYATAHPDEARAMTLNVAPNTDPDKLAVMLLNNWPDSMNPEDLQYLAKAAVKYGLLKAEPDYDTIVWTP